VDVRGGEVAKGVVGGGDGGAGDGGGGTASRGCGIAAASANTGSSSGCVAAVGGVTAIKGDGVGGSTSEGGLPRGSVARGGTRVTGELGCAFAGVALCNVRCSRRKMRDVLSRSIASEVSYMVAAPWARCATLRSFCCIVFFTLSKPSTLATNCLDASLLLAASFTWGCGSGSLIKPWRTSLRPSLSIHFVCTSVGIRHNPPKWTTS
jgi:hypothetical protein